jgi:hypothetical protein
LFSAVYYWDHQTKENGMGGACGTHGKGENAYAVLDGKPEGNSPEDVGINARVIKWSLIQQNGRTVLKIFWRS